MRKYKTTILILILFESVTSIVRLAQTSCQLCMQTYKNNCTICYNRCNDSKDLINCTFSACTQTNSSGSCTNYSNTSLTSSNCLGKCCSYYAGTNTTFSQTNFNLCIEKDADNPENINIGLTLGLVLALLVIIFFAGLACLLAIIFIDSKDGDNKVVVPNSAEGLHSQRQNNKLFSQNVQYSTVNQNPTLQPQHVQVTPVNYGATVTYANPIPVLPNATMSSVGSSSWINNGYMLTGTCQICYQKKVNFQASCGHVYHYPCLCRNLKYDERCPICHITGSLNSAKIFCSNCATRFRTFDIGRERFGLDNAAAMENARCDRCK